MARSYSMRSTVEQLENALKNIDVFYNAGCVNWSGLTEEGLFYSDVIAKNLLNLGIKDMLSRITPIQRKNYKIDHAVVAQRETNRHEEICAKELYKKDLPFLGKITDYQVPLKASQADRAGKIDLVAYRYKPKNILIIELKFKRNTETLLRAVLEISTYFHKLSHKNFLSSYEEFAGFEPGDIKKTLLLADGTNSFAEAKGLEQTPNLKRLISELEVDIFGLHPANGCFDIERIYT